MNTKFETYLAIVKINAKQLINAMVIAKQIDDKYLLANTIDDVVNNLVSFNIPYNPIFGNVIDGSNTLFEMYLDGAYSKNDFVPTPNEYCDIEMTIDYLKNLSNDCINDWNDWKKMCKLSAKSSNSLLINVFGEYTATQYIMNDKTLMGAN